MRPQWLGLSLPTPPFAQNFSVFYQIKFCFFASHREVWSHKLSSTPGHQPGLISAVFLQHDDISLLDKEENVSKDLTGKEVWAARSENKRRFKVPRGHGCLETLDKCFCDCFLFRLRSQPSC